MPDIYVQDDAIDLGDFHELEMEIERIQTRDMWNKRFSRAGSNMYEFNDVQASPCLAAFRAAMDTPDRLNMMAEILGTGPLIPDPHMVGAGFSMIENGGDLKWHVDFNWNDTIKLYRAASLIVYINEPEEGGVLEFENGPTIAPKRGRVALFKHSETVRHRVTPVKGIRTAVRFFYYSSNLEAPEGYHRSLYGVDEKGKPIDVQD